jgi:hypothetical protein
MFVGSADWLSAEATTKNARTANQARFNADGINSPLTYSEDFSTDGFV